MSDIIEECPICKQHTFVWESPGFPTCTHCGWYPGWVPFDIEDFQEVIDKYENSLDKSLLINQKYWWRS